MDFVVCGIIVGRVSVFSRAFRSLIVVYVWVFLFYVGLCLSDIVGRSRRNDNETNSIPDHPSLTFLGTRSVVCKLAERSIGRGYESDAIAVPLGQN